MNVNIYIYESITGSTDLFHGEILQSTSDNCHSPACLLTGGRVILYLYLLTVSHNIGCWCFENGFVYGRRFKDGFHR